MAEPARLHVEVLGPLRARRPDGSDATPAGHLQRRLLALLVAERGREVPADVLVEALWPERPPTDPGAALQTHVFRLRRSLGPATISSTAAGYRLDSDGVEVDGDRLAAAVAEALVQRATDPGVALRTIEAALASWRGAPYPDLADTDVGRVEAARLDEARTRAREERAAALSALGRAAESIGDLTALADEQPLRERPRALLMDALAATGRTAEALRVYDDLRRALGDELGIEPSAALAEQHRGLLGAARGGTPGAGPPAAGDQPAEGQPGAVASTRPVPHRLPVATTSLVGRDDLVDHALAMVAAHRCVTLLGTGGAGKTRLAVEVGHRLVAAEPGRSVVLCELAGATPETAVDVVATTLGLDRGLGTVRAGDVAAVVRASEAVLVLDNCEHVLEAVAELAEELLAGAPQVRLLATSRERLRVPGEHLCPVPPLPLAEADTARDAPAVRLFLERAGAVRPGFDPSDDELVAVAEIVRRLDGLPLAIELAAARLHALDVHEVAGGLDRRFRFLTSGSRTTSRHRSLGAAVAWSYDLLDPELQRAFVEVSVFSGAFDAAAAAAVTGLDVPTATEALAELCERSLLSRTGDGRCLLLDSLRAFGRDRLEADGRADELADRHAAHLLAWTEEARARLAGLRSTPVLGEIEGRLPDLRTALHRMVARGDLDSAARLVLALEDYAFFCLRPEVLLWAERVVALDPDARHPLLAGAWATSALGAWMAGDVAETGRRAQRALDIHRASASADLSPVVANAVGSHALFEGRLDDALVWYRRCLEVARDDRIDYLIALACEVVTLGYQGSEEAGAAAQALLDDVGDARTCAAAYAWYAAGEAVLGHNDDLAAERLQRAIELAVESGTPFVEGVAGASLASIEARSGDPLAATRRYLGLIAHWRRAGMWSIQWTMLRSIAGLLVRLDRLREAAVLVGAVTSTPKGHRIFGADEATLAALATTLRGALGDEAYDAALAEGAVLDGEAAAEHALCSLVALG